MARMPYFSKVKDVDIALTQLSKVLRHKNQTRLAGLAEAKRDSLVMVNPEPRDIRLGLERMKHVVPDKQPWEGIHVAGTNGKGSICAFLAGLFRQVGLSYGMYISPAFPERHDGVVINGRSANKKMYEAERELVRNIYRKYEEQWKFPGEMGFAGPLSPFELETATAFRVFNRMQVKYGIVEVGMGGSKDATTAMLQKSIHVFSNIDLDHQEFLGNKLTDIARVKAGIMRRGAPVIVDDSNITPVVSILKAHADKLGLRFIMSSEAAPILDSVDLDRFNLARYQKQNLACAVLAFRTLFPKVPIDVERLLESNPFLPGRMEYINISKLTAGKREKSVLVDGGHNRAGLKALADHVGEKLRQDKQPVTWVIALSASEMKPVSHLLGILLEPQDNLAFVEFAPGNNAPDPVPAEMGREHGMAMLDSEDQVYDGEPTIGRAIQWASDKAGEGPIVVAGSLYLIRELYGLPGIDSPRMPGERAPGPGQLWQYLKASRRRSLTQEEEREFKRARRHWYLSPIRNPVFRKRGRSSQAPVRNGVPEAQRDAVFHKREADAYASQLAGVKELIAEEMEDSGTDDTEALSTLRDNAAKLKELVESHQTAHREAMHHVRGHATLPGKKFMSYNDVFNRPPPQSALDTPQMALFRQYQEPQAPKAAAAEEQPEEKRRDQDETSERIERRRAQKEERSQRERR